MIAYLNKGSVSFHQFTTRKNKTLPSKSATEPKPCCTLSAPSFLSRGYYYHSFVNARPQHHMMPHSETRLRLDILLIAAFIFLYLITYIFQKVLAVLQILAIVSVMTVAAHKWRQPRQSLQQMQDILIGTFPFGDDTTFTDLSQATKTFLQTIVGWVSSGAFAIQQHRQQHRQQPWHKPGQERNANKKSA